MMGDISKEELHLRGGGAKLRSSLLHEVKHHEITNHDVEQVDDDDVLLH